MTKRFFVLQLILLFGLGAVHFLPSRPSAQPTGVNLELPELVGEWYGVDQAVTKMELVELGPETTFARKLYTNGRGDQVFVSIVLAGHDMNTSIHQPERCLPAQGWTVEDTRKLALPLDSSSKTRLRLTRLRNMRNVKEEGGNPVKLYNLNYYWFVGFTDICPSHIERNFRDIRDRLQKGYSQRWAYITVASNVSKQFNRFGRSEAETDELIQGMIRQLVPSVLKNSVNLSS